MLECMASDHNPDPWLAILDRWVLRILKLGCALCVLIFVAKIVLLELGYGK